MVGRLVGREAELRSALMGCRAEAAGVALLGVAGIGKSRLVRELRMCLAEEGWLVQSIAGSYAARSIPLGPVASLLPEDPPADLAVLLSHVLRNLVGEPGPQRLLLAVDDAHLLDETTQALLVEIVHRRAATVVLAVRSGEPLGPSLARLLNSDGLRRIELGPLSRRELGELAQVIVGSELEARTLQRLSSVVDGNPLLLREVLADARQGGALEYVDGCFRLLGEPPVGVRLQEMVRARLAQLPPHERDALQLIAVGEPLDLAMLDGLDPAVLPALEERRLTRIELLDGRWVCTTDHSVIGESIREAMPTSGRLQQLRRLCSLLPEDVPASTSIRAASWFQSLGEPFPPALAAKAAHQALVALDTDTAVDLARSAATQHWRAAFVLAEVARAAGDGMQAALWFERAADLAQDDAAIRRVAMARGAVHAFVLQEPDVAIGVLRDASQDVSNHEQSLELLCEAAFMAALLGDFREVLTLCRRVLAEPEVDALTTWTAAINLGYAQIMLGDVADIDRTLDVAGRHAERTRHEHPEGTDLYSALTVGAKILLAHVPQAARQARERLDVLGADRAHRGVTAAISVEALLLAGDRQAVEVGQEAVAQLVGYDPFNALSFGQGYAALAAALAGDHERARAILDSVDRGSMDVRSTAVVGRAESATVASDDRDAAARLALDAGWTAIEGSHVSLGVFAVWDALVLGDRSGAGALAEVCRGSSSPLVQMMGALVGALDDGDVDAASIAAQALEDAEAPLLASTAYLMTAELVGDGLLARRLAARSLAIEARVSWLQRAWLQPRVEDGPSRREIDVALLALTGRSNQEIADQLFLSRRTVANHLQRLYRRLEAAGRGALAEVLVGAAVANQSLDGSSPSADAATSSSTWRG